MPQVVANILCNFVYRKEFSFLHDNNNNNNNNTKHFLALTPAGAESDLNASTDGA